MREKTVEAKLVKAVKSMGGLAPKFISPGLDGVPDRLVLLPGGKLAFIELKAPGKGGVEAYLDVIDRDMDLSFIDETVDSGFESPFAEGRAEKIAQLIIDTLTESPDGELTPSEGASEAVFANDLIPAA